MELTLKEAQETKIFYIKNGKIESTNLAYFVNESIDITTTPRGVSPRVFLESEIFEIDKSDFDSEEEFLNEINSTQIYFADELRNACIDDFFEIKKDVFQLEYYVISSWGVGGNNYSSGKSHYSNVFLSEDKANDELFNRTYNYDFLPDDQRDTRYFYTEDEAFDALVEQISEDWSCDVDVVKHILRKQRIVDDARYQKKIEVAKKESDRVNSLAKIYSKMINKVEGESYKETAKRLSDAIGKKIESKVFHATVKMLRT